MRLASLLVIHLNNCIFARKGDKQPQALLAGSGRENKTVQVCSSATGEILAPYIQGKKVLFETMKGGPTGARYGVSKNRWMTMANFLDWFESVFVPAIPKVDH